MYQVWKFPFNVTDRIAITMPKSARILSVDLQRGQPCVWALIDPEKPKRKRRFRLAGTGHPIPYEECERFVGTFQMRGGDLVFHLFDLGEES